MHEGEHADDLQEGSAAHALAHVLRRLAPFALVLAALVVIAFVAQQPDEGAGEQVPATDTTAEATTTPPDPTTLPTQSELVDVRVESHGFADQVVFELADGSDERAAAAVVAPSSAPTAGPCEAPAVAGRSFLTVELPLTASVDPRGVPEHLRGPFSFDATDQVAEVVVACAAEGRAWAVIGLAGDGVHRTEVLTSPPRLLVEVYPA